MPEKKSPRKPAPAADAGALIERIDMPAEDARRGLVPADIPEIARALGCGDINRDLARLLTANGWPVSHQTIHNWRTGNAPPPPARWARVCEILRPLLAKAAKKAAKKAGAGS